MLKAFHLAPSLKIITNTQATINHKEKTLSAKTRFSQIQAFGSRTKREYQSSTLFAVCEDIHWWPLESPHKGPVIWKVFRCHDVIMGDKALFLPPMCSDRKHDISTNSIYTYKTLLYIMPGIQISMWKVDRLNVYAHKRMAGYMFIHTITVTGYMFVHTAQSQATILYTQTNNGIHVCAYKPLCYMFVTQIVDRLCVCTHANERQATYLCTQTNEKLHVCAHKPMRLHICTQTVHKQMVC